MNTEIGALQPNINGLERNGPGGATNAQPGPNHSGLHQRTDHMALGRNNRFRAIAQRERLPNWGKPR